MVATEWEEFSQLNPRKYLEMMSNKHVIDLRYVLNRSEWEDAGAKFFQLGDNL